MPSNTPRSLAAFLFLFPVFAFGSARPADIVDLRTVDSRIRVDMLYFGPKNFTGAPVAGYKENVCLLAKPAAIALKNAQDRLESRMKSSGRSLYLAVRDCYRPQKAVQEFVEWAKQPEDPRAKKEYFPDLTKRRLIEDNYISPISGHSRASSIDLTIVEKKDGSDERALPMGTEIDFFGEKSHTANGNVTAEEAANRQLLKKVMSPEFKNYSKEWWHYVLVTEPYPKTFFDFDVQAASARLPQSVDQFATHFSEPELLAELDHDASSPLSLVSLFRRIHAAGGLKQPEILGSGHPGNQLLATYSETYGKMAAVLSADIARIVQELGIDWEKDITKTYDPSFAKSPEGKQHRKNGNVTRILNEKWLSSATGHFLLSGIVNRIDRREFTPGSCGEVRLIYRLGYDVQMGGQTYASRMPLTVNMVFNYRDDGDNCRKTALAWRQGREGELSPPQLAEKILTGPLDFSRLSFKQMEVNAQVARFPSDLERETGRNFAGQAVYLMRIFGLRDGAFKALKLENTPDVLEIRKSTSKQKLLRDFISQNAAAIDAGVFLMPDELLADLAITYSTAGSSRLANKPFDLLLKPEEAQALLGDSKRFSANGRGLLERLNTSTCMGCHQASSTAGFHFLGNDRIDFGRKPAEVKVALDGNRLVLPFSAHLFADLVRREEYVTRIAKALSPDIFRPHPSAPPADWANTAPAYTGAGDNMPCPLQNELAAEGRWGCDKSRGLSCAALVTNNAQSSGLGQCVPSASRIYSGLSCRKNVIQDQTEALARAPSGAMAYNTRAFLDRVVKDEQIYSLTEGSLDANNFNCRPTRIGVPLGRVTKACSPSQMSLKGLKLRPAVPDEMCAVVGGKGFEEMAKGYFNSKKFAEGVGRGVLNTCSPTRFCREDYICQEMPDFLTGPRFGVASSVLKELRETKVGFCTPTYFVYQLRLDGHPNPN